MALSSYEYWKRREEHNRKVTDHSLRRRQAYLRQAYNDMMRECTHQIEAFYARYAAREGISITEAKARVAQADIKAYERKAAKYVAEKDFSQAANEEMRLYNLTMRVNRLELLKAELNLELTAGYDAVDKYFRGELENDALNGFKDMAGILGKSVQNPAKRAEALVNASFQNATFSQRLWQHHDALMAQLTTDLTSSIIRGDHPRELARTLKKRFDASTYAAERLMITEAARIQIDAQTQSLTRNGYEKYVYITEGNPCPVCAELEGQVFEIKDMQPGKNAPPMHPICRCGIAAAMDQQEFEKWLNSRAEARKMLTKSEAESVQRAPNVSGMTAEEINREGGKILGHSWESYRKKFLGNAVPFEESMLDKKIGWGDAVKIGKLKDKGLISKTYAQLSKLTSKFYSPLSGLDFMDKNEALVSSAFASTHHNWETGSAIMRFNPVKFGDKGIQRIRELTEKNWCVHVPKGKEIDFLISHEFGHSILTVGDNLPSSKRNFVQTDFGSIKRARKEILSVWDSYSDEISGLESAYRSYSKKLDSKLITDFIPPTEAELAELNRRKKALNDVKISTYSLSKQDEFIAESFADVILNGDNAKSYSKKVYSILEKYFGKE